MTLVEFLVVLGIIGLLVALMLPATRSSRQAARRSYCRNNLKQIGIALHLYADEYGEFPPAYTVDADGNPLHSWRTLILPYLDERPLYETIDLSKPWNDPANAEAYSKSLSVYRCPSAEMETGKTSYLAAVTPEGGLQPVRSKAVSELKDLFASPLVAEVNGYFAVHWMSPEDADESLLGIQGAKLEMPHRDRLNILFADGSVRSCSTSELRNLSRNATPGESGAE